MGPATSAMILTIHFGEIRVMEQIVPRDDALVTTA